MQAVTAMAAHYNQVGIDLLGQGYNLMLGRSGAYVAFRIGKLELLLDLF